MVSFSPLVLAPLNTFAFPRLQQSYTKAVPWLLHTFWTHRVCPVHAVILRYDRPRVRRQIRMKLPCAKSHSCRSLNKVGNLIWGGKLNFPRKQLRSNLRARVTSGPWLKLTLPTFARFEQLLLCIVHLGLCKSHDLM